VDVRIQLAVLALTGVLALAPGVSRAAAPQLPPGLGAQAGDEGLVLTAQGAVLYRLDLDRYRARGKQANAQLIDARCAQVCDRLWRPAPPPANFVAAGDWGIATRADGVAQLTYKGDPLYTFTGRSLQEAAESSVAPPYFSSYTAKTVQLRDGVPVGTVYWREALYEPTPPRLDLPAGVQVKWDKTAFVFVSSDGRKLRQPKPGASCAADCAGMEPLAAPLAALPVGVWRPTEEKDGRRVWSYRGRIVYLAKVEGAPNAAMTVMEAR
jgi:predicted lipoprotein with Yx(FWY)xxD motif